MSNEFDLRLRTCCFSGHRNIREDQVGLVKKRTEDILRELILQHDIRYIGIGGAQGYDYLCAQIAFQLREKEFPHIRVILIYPFDGYQNRWPRRQKELYAQIWGKFDKRVCVAKEGNSQAFLARNRYMVDHSSVLIAYCNRSRSGTGYTVNYAMQQGIKVFNLAEQLSDANNEGSGQ